MITSENNPTNKIIRPLSKLSVQGARVHNLKNIDVDIPHNTLTVITGLSGSGKSSLAFDTIFAEGQRRYIETFSAYARNMLGNLERPDVDNITGLSPVIAIEQKTVNKNPRSTIGTTTEVYDFLRLLYARAGQAVSYVTGEPMVKYTREQIVNLILTRFSGRKVYILAPLVKNRKGHYKELFEQLRKKGFLTVRVDGELRDLTLNMMVDRYKNHDIELVIDRLKVSDKDITRLDATVQDALRQGDKQVMVYDVDADKVTYFSQALMDAASGISYREPAPHNFSFNSPLGACPCCKGLGYVNIVDRGKIIPNPSLSIHEGAIVPLGKYRNAMVFWQIDAICKKYGCTIKTPVANLPEEAMGEILNGTSERLVIENDTMATYNYFQTYDGLVKYIEMQQADEASASAKKWSEGFFSRGVCPECNGDRLNREALHFFVDGKNIAELCRLDISDLYDWSKDVESRLSPTHAVIAHEIMKEIRSRLKFLIDVGLDYLQLNRASATLSGGESQRIRLATQLGSQLVNVLYILDEPSIGLHQRDNRRLIDSLKQLRDASNSILVVEHDKDIMLDADHIIDIGPKAGRKGGEVVFSGTPEEMLATDTLTARYLNGKDVIPWQSTPRKGSGKKLVLRGAKGNNLRDVTLTLPLGRLICVSGVSGSGKSSLVNGTLQPILSQKFYRSHTAPLPYDTIEGLENIDKVITVDQSPLGKSPRSNPATYTGVFTAIRDLYASLSEAKIRGYRPGRFSFNVAGGRCETCMGNGYTP
ncbi:MAG: excinuclease ABC subunit UvrA, partial [Duncaniella sp.]|nr:excinuclease ABC subunit UvrA [Duncaniella sp.]